MTVVKNQWYSLAQKQRRDPCLEAIIKLKTGVEPLFIAPVFALGIEAWKQWITPLEYVAKIWYYSCDTNIHSIRSTRRFL